MSIAPKDKAITIRQPATALLLVDSNDQQEYNKQGFRIDSTTPGRIYINNGRPLAFGYITRLALTEMNIQWDTPNVNSSNNTLTMALYSATNATPAVVALIGFIRITIAPKFFTPDALAIAIATQLNTNPAVIAAFGAGSFTVTYDDEGDGAFKILMGAAYPPIAPATSGNAIGYFKIFSSTAPQSATAFAPLVGFPTLVDDLLFCMGIQPVTQAVAEPNGFYSQITGAYAPMLYTPYIDVVSNLLTKHQNVSDGTTSKQFTSSKLARVYFSNETIINGHIDLPSSAAKEDVTSVCNIVGTSPIVFRREFITPKQIQWDNKENVDFVDIQVLDYKGNPIRLEEQVITTVINSNSIVLAQANNTAFQFTLMVTES